MTYIQKNNPFPVTSCGRRRSFTQGGSPGDDRHKTSRFGKSPAKHKGGHKKDPPDPHCHPMWLEDGSPNLDYHHWPDCPKDKEGKEKKMTEEEAKKKFEDDK